MFAKIALAAVPAVVVAALVYSTVLPVFAHLGAGLAAVVPH